MHLFSRLNGSVVLVLTLALTVAADVDFGQCLEQFKTGAFGSQGGIDNHGRPVSNLSLATGLTYETCTRVCGTGQESFSWSLFSQQFSSWLLPYLALASQLPYGANDKLENLESMLLTVGSPTLAVYSLILTVLNNRFISRQFSKYKQQNAQYAVRALKALQQSPMRVNPDKSLLIALAILPDNKIYWQELVKGLDFPHTWTISSASSIVWVIIAYLFTVIDSFDSMTQGNLITAFGACGQAVGSLMLWLLPVVIGWLLISPKCDSIRLSAAIDRANRYAHILGEDGVPILASSAAHSPAITLQHFGDDFQLRKDEQCTAPIFNYARFLPWVQLVQEVAEIYDNAQYHSLKYMCGRPNDMQSGRTENSVNSSKEQLEGTISRMESRITTAENLDNTINPEPKQNLPLEGAKRATEQHIWGPSVISTMTFASILALFVQWGTTGAAVVIVWFTPALGLGCRSLSYILYAVLSTLSWMLFTLSSLIAHYLVMTKKRQRLRSSFWRVFLRALSISLRRLGKFLAILNAIWVVTCCTLQFSNFFNRCLCQSTALIWKGLAYVIIEVSPEDIMPMKVGWIGGTILAACAGTSLIVAVFLVEPYDDRQILAY